MSTERASGDSLVSIAIGERYMGKGKVKEAALSRSNSNIHTYDGGLSRI